MKINLKERKREIFVCAIYAVIFIVLSMVFNGLDNKYKELERKEVLILSKYNNLKNNNFTKEELEIQEQELEKEYNDLEGKLPTELESKLSAIMPEIEKDTNLTLGRYSVSAANPVNTSDKSQLKDVEYVEVKVNSFSGTYMDIKQFLDYISRYKYKVDVTEIDMVENFGGYSGSFTLVFYGII